MLGIIGAMEEEVSKLLSCMEQVSKKTKAGMEFHRGKLEGADHACYPPGDQGWNGIL